MKKRYEYLATVAMGLAIFSIYYTIFVLHPGSRYEPECQRILAKVAHSQAVRQEKALDPAFNGYLDPEFLPFWEANNVDPTAAISAKSSPPRPSKIDSLLGPVLDLSALSTGKAGELESLVAANTNKALQPLEDFKKYYPKVHQVQNSRIFVVPEPQPRSQAAPMVDFIALRKLALGSSALAEYLTLTQQGDFALEVCGDSLHGGYLLADSCGSLTELMMALAIESIAQSSLTMVLQSPCELNLNSLNQLKRVLEQTDFQPKVLADTLECEFCRGLAEVEQTDRQPQLQGGVLEVQWFPGLLGREIRLYKNDFVPIIQQARLNQVLTSNLQADPWDWFLGRHGILSSVAIPNCAGTSQQLTILGKRQALLHLYTAIRIYRLKHKRWPIDFGELTRGGFQPLRGLDLARVRYRPHDRSVDLELELDPADKKSLPKFKNPDMKKWQILSAPPWVLH